MTTGLGKGIENAMKDTGFDKSEEKEGVQWEPFDWTSENYQLMCREYRQALGLVNMQNYESEYQTESEVLYWMNLHRTRGYGPYLPKEAIADPPETFIDEWVRKRGVTLSSSTSDAEPAGMAELTEQDAKHIEFDRRFEQIKIIVDGEVAPDAALINEFLSWVVEQGCRFDITTFNPSWAYLRQQAKRDKEREWRLKCGDIIQSSQKPVQGKAPEPIPSPIPPLDKPARTVWADINDKSSMPQANQTSEATAGGPKPVWSNEKGGFVYG